MDKEEIKKIQLFLKKQGYAIGVDGVIGPETRGVIKAFQKDNGLKITGRLNSKTLNRVQSINPNIDKTKPTAAENMTEYLETLISGAPEYNVDINLNRGRGYQIIERPRSNRRDTIGNFPVLSGKEFGTTRTGKFSLVPSGEYTKGKYSQIRMSDKVVKDYGGNSMTIMDQFGNPIYSSFDKKLYPNLKPGVFGIHAMPIQSVRKRTTSNKNYWNAREQKIADNMEDNKDMENPFQTAGCLNTSSGYYEKAIREPYEKYGGVKLNISQGKPEEAQQNYKTYNFLNGDDNKTGLYKDLLPIEQRNSSFYLGDPFWKKDEYDAMMKNKKNNKNTKKGYAVGTAIQGYITDPLESMEQAQIDASKAKYAAMSNPWLNGMQAIGGMVMNYGLSNINSPGTALNGFKDTSNITQAVSTGVPKTADLASAPISEGVTGLTGVNAGDPFLYNEAMNMKNSHLGDVYGLNLGLGFAAGGQIPQGVPVSIDKNEVGELPDGGLFEVKGGRKNVLDDVDAVLPPGTEMFSSRIKRDGETMAERKKKREKRLDKIVKGRNPNDPLVKKTLERAKQVNAKEESEDKKVQEYIKMLREQKKNKGKKGKLEPGIPGVETQGLYTGGTVLDGDPPVDPLILAYMQATGYGGKFMAESGADFSTENNLNTVAKKNNDLNTVTNTDSTFMPSEDALKKGNKVIDRGTEYLKTIFGGELPTAGDLGVIGGNMYQAFMPSRVTEQMNATRIPNVNEYKGYGDEALQTLESSLDIPRQQAEMALDKNRLLNNTTKKNLRNTARGVNSMRMNSLMADMMTGRNNSDIITKAAAMKAGLIKDLASFQGNVSKTIAAGEMQTQQNRQADHGAYYTQKHGDKINEGMGIAMAGKGANDIYERGMTRNAINDMYEYVKAQRDGSVVQKDVPITSGSTASEIIANFDPKAIGKTEKEWNALTESEKFLVLINNNIKLA